MPDAALEVANALSEAVHARSHCALEVEKRLPDAQPDRLVQEVHKFLRVAREGDWRRRTALQYARLGEARALLSGMR